MASDAMTMDASRLPPDWSAALGHIEVQPFFKALAAFVAAERNAHTIFPPVTEVFSAFHLTPFAAARVVILGQDPYHGPGQAHGLSFSVKPGVAIPPSLRNMYKELAADLGVQPPSTGSLVPWAKQGVLLLNAVLTVRHGEANSHAGRGWETLTDAAIEAISHRADPAVFVLWGRIARKKARLIDRARHSVIEGAHPSPLSARLFLGSRPFSAINAALVACGHRRIDWAGHAD